MEILELKQEPGTKNGKLNKDAECKKSTNEDGRIFGRREEDATYRHRLFHTFSVCFSMFALGLMNALLGPTFPDLRLIIGENLSTASWIFTAKSLGGLIGAVCGGLAYDRYNKIGVFICSVVGMGIVSGVTPWCSQLEAMLIIHMLHGVFAASVDTAATADVTLVWLQKSGPFMQALNFAYSAGAIISPLLCNPFLAKVDLHTLSLRLNISVKTPSEAPFSVSPENLMDPYNFKEHTEFGNKSSILYGNTRIHIPYGIVSAVCLLSGSLYFIVYCVYGYVYKTCSCEFADANIDTSKKQYFLNRTKTILFTVLLALTLLFYSGSENCFIGFLMTFLISNLNWSKAQASTASSYFWIAIAVGRLTGVVIVKKVNLSLAIVMFILLVTFGTVLLLVAVIYSIHSLVWLSVVVIGYGMSIIFGSVCSWLSKNVRTLTGKITSIFFTFVFIGNMTFPILVGYLMDNVSQMVFIYSCLILISLMSVCFIFTLVFFAISKKADEKSEAEVTVKLN